MSVLRRSEEPAQDAAKGDDRLGGVRALAHDEEERPSREDRTYGETIFNRSPVPLPRWLTGHRRKPH